MKNWLSRYLAFVLSAFALSACVWLVTVKQSGGEPSSSFKKVEQQQTPHTGMFCSSTKSFTKLTLKAVHDAPVASLLRYAELKGERKFEASDVMLSGGHLYAICDSSWAVLKIEETMPRLSSMNTHIGTPGKGYVEGESGFEAILRDATRDAVYLVRESVDISGRYVTASWGARGLSGKTTELGAMASHPKEYHAEVYQIELPATALEKTATNYTVVEACPSEFRFEGTSKGFEGARSLRGADGVLYLLGLCEGNDCAEGDVGKAVGHGKIVVMRREVDAEGQCYWKTVKILDLPIEGFVDYSALDIHHETETLAITSQENSQVWLGRLSTARDGAFDPDQATFEQGAVYDFPRNQNCEPQYCNIEGIQWLEGGGPGTPQILVAVSDKMKSKGRQAHTCLDKDQSFHLFAIPS